MLIANGILESLIQDGKTIDLIQSYLRKCCELDISIAELKKYINDLYVEQLIRIVFPPEYLDLKRLNDRDFEHYWFELSNNGEKECIKRNLMIGE